MEETTTLSAIKSFVMLDRDGNNDSLNSNIFLCSCGANKFSVVAVILAHSLEEAAEVCGGKLQEEGLIKNKFGGRVIIFMEKDFTPSLLEKKNVNQGDLLEFRRGDVVLFMIRGQRQLRLSLWELPFLYLG